jgi:eukaryotic-like serine/threonine-protein kinase
VGQDISHYHVLGKLGQGAIGLVYKAEDLKLGRTVALKFLTAELLEDQRARERFEREARAVAALNHPHIATLYEVGDHEGSPYLAMELVDGRALKGPVPVKQAIEYGIQMADALAEAHAAGIVHRDLKPANILVTEKGSVKVLDFGLAKLAEPEGAPASTQTAGLAGTPGYMAPEQIEGTPADTRSDIFAFGCILYEPLSGRRAFPGETITAALTAAATTEPKPLDGAPERLDELVRLCLRKDPESRLQHIHDARIMLEVLREGLGFRGTGAPRPRAMVATRRARLWWVPAAALLLAAVGLGAWMRWFRATVAAPKIIPLTTYSGQQADPALSPDGKQVAFSWNGETSDNFDIYVKLVDGGTPLRLTTNPASEASPAWSPDGGRIAFLRFLGFTADILVIPSLGGQERKLGQITLPLRGGGLSWSPDGKFVAVSGLSPSGNDGIYLVSVETSEKRLISSPPLEYIGDCYSSFSPDGRSLALIRYVGSVSADIYVVPMTADGQAATQPRRITSGLGPILGLDWTPDGRSLVFSVATSFDMALRIVAVAGGQPAPLPGAGESGYTPSVSRHGNRLAYKRSVANSNIWRIPGPNADNRKAAPEKWIASTPGNDGPQYSPDGKRIVFISTRSGTYEVWTCASNGRELAQLTSLGMTGSPRWSPDSRWIAFDVCPKPARLTSS